MSEDTVDLTTMTADLGQLHCNVVAEEERRATIDRAPDRVGDVAREAIQAGADPVVLRAALEAALTGQQD